MLLRSDLNRRALLKAAAGAAMVPSFGAASGSDARLRGVFIILSTPFTTTKAVDYEDLAGEVDFLDRCGVQALVWPQLSSEYPQLTKEERLRGMETIAKAAKGKRPALVLGVQGEDTTAMLEYAHHAEDLAPDALIAIPPNRAKSLDDYRQYFTAIAKLTKRPVFIQTSGGAPGLEPTVDFIVQMAREFPHLGYVKEETEPTIPRIQALIQHRPDPIRCVLGANFGLGFPYELRLGTDGTMTGGAMYADVYERIWALHQQNRLDDEREVFSKLLLMTNMDRQIPGVRLYILKKRGVFKTTVSRQRNITFTPDAIAEIEHNFAALGPYLKV